MQITLTNTGKRYNRDWIFRHLNFKFIPGRSYAITGPNGSGKSTLLQVIAGAVLQSEGKVEYSSERADIPSPEIEISSLAAHKEISIATPYLELVEEMTANEMIRFHSTFKKLSKPGSDILQDIGLAKASEKQVRYFSSGMKQRLKLGLAFFSETSVLLLDEPTTNLDEEGILLYHRLVALCAEEKLVIVSSNDKQEYDFCDEILEVNKFK